MEEMSIFLPTSARMIIFWKLTLGIKEEALMKEFGILLVEDNIDFCQESG